MKKSIFLPSARSFFYKVDGEVERVVSEIDCAVHVEHIELFLAQQGFYLIVVFFGQHIFSFINKPAVCETGSFGFGGEEMPRSGKANG